MRRPPTRSLAVLAIALLLASLGIYTIVMKSTWTLMDDGVFWKTSSAGLVAGRVAEGGPGAKAGLRVGDVLLAVDGESLLTSDQVQAHLAARRAGDRIAYSLLRAEEPQSLVVLVQRLPRGNVTLFYYLSMVGFFSLVVGTIVMLRRPPDRAALHFYAICLLFFLVYSTSDSGKLDLADWAIFWIDNLAILLLPVVFLHFCLSFPERRLPRSRAWLVPAAYAPALALAGAAIASQVLFVTTPATDLLWRVTSAIDRSKPLYFAALFAISFLILLDSYRRTRNPLARRQMKWLVWGTGTGVLPFFAFYALPYALGSQPRLALELAAYVALALIPLSLAYAVVKHRLMDVELVARRSLAWVLAVAVIVGIALLANELLNGLVSGDGEPHAGLIASLSALLVIALFTPLKTLIEDAMDRLVLRERYVARRALLRLSQDLNADLDLGRITERLLAGVSSALGVDTLAVFLPGPDGAFAIFRSLGCPDETTARLEPGGTLLSRLAGGEPLNLEAAPELAAELGDLPLAFCFPCRVKGELIALLGVGRKQGSEPLNSEEAELLQALAGQVATAFMNGRLYLSLRDKASELERLTEYNENILESMDSGILVLDLSTRVVRWNRTMESLYGRRREQVLGRHLDDVLPASFMEALRGSLVPGGAEEIAHIYKLHLPTADGRSLMVNVSLAPFEAGPGQRRGTVMILEDVTARVRLEEQLQHAEKMASIGLLVAGIAHEVNTPLTGISSYTQMLREQVRPEDLRYPLLEKIEKQTFRAAKIINSLLNFARSAGAEMEELDVNRLLLDVVSLLEHQLDKAHIKVRRELAEYLPRVRGNENRLQQVLFNLILNAKDAMPRGGWLTLVTSADEDTVVIEVKDTGVGIKREDIKRIYDPFYTTKGIGRGTGLGLSVSYGIVQEHGGAIFVDSMPGKGTTFQVALPGQIEAEAARR